VTSIPLGRTESRSTEKLTATAPYWENRPEADTCTGPRLAMIDPSVTIAAVVGIK